MDTVRPNIEQLAATFDRFAERECKGVSDQYYYLAKEVSKEIPLLDLARQCRERQPVPNLFFGAVHYLLLQAQDEELARYYPSISKQKSPAIHPELFREFCARQSEVLIEVLKNKIVQTNSINRTAYIMPLLSSY